MGFLTRLLAGLTAAAALGAGLTGTANAVDTTDATGTTKSVVKLTADDTNNLPDHIVNGSFDYPSVPSWTGLAGSSSNKNNKGKRFATINPGTGKYGSGCAMSTTGRAIPNWNRSNFAWNSTQGDVHYPGVSCEVGNVELNYDSVHHNQFAELTADQQGTAIYQDVKVTPGTMMKWSLKHSSATSAYVDKMQVMIGEPYKETAQEATRIASENGNKVGEKMTTISTPTTSDRADNKKWDTYSGTYLVPDGVTTVRFTFKSVASAEWYSGNDLDDIEFSRSYKLTYDKNSSDAAGQVPSNQRGKENTVQPAKSKTSGTVKTVADTNASLPDHLVNGDFSVNYHDQWKDSFGGWTSIDPNAGKTLHATSLPNGSSWKWTAINGWDKSKFGWTSTQKAGSNVQQKANAVELQYDDSTADNVYAELCAYEAGTAIYQDIRTVPGTLYKVRLKHASLNSTYLDKMQVMIGTPGHEQPVEMTRTSVNGHGDKLNEKSTTIATKVTNGNNRHHADQWETYEGTYLIPDGQTTTRFTFKSIDAKQLDYGNVLDDIVFDKAYKLSYDKNASDATGKIPSNQRGKENTVEPAKAKTTGTVKTVVDTSDGLPTELVNGDFEYPEADVLSQNLRDKKRNWWGVSRKDKMVYESDNPTKWVSLPSTFDSDRFAWDSSEAGKTSGVQEGSSQCHTNEVELQRDSHTGNMYAELSPYQAQSSIRQYIRTTPGTLYKVRLKHASLSSEYLDKMQVLIGADGNEQPVRMTRVESQNGLDATGKSTASTTISTHASNKAEISWGSGLGYHSSRNHDGQWATYEGVYVATSDVTVFMFKNVDSPSYNTGNLLDDVVFTKAYKLTYDKNSADASGQIPSNQRGKENTTQPAKTKTNGTVKTVADTNASLPDHLVNGDFSVNYHDQWKDSFGGWTSIDPNAGKTLHATSLPNGSSWKWTAINGWDKSKFGWTSTQKAGSNVQQKANAVELQYDDSTADNVYAELCAYEAGTAIYQDIRTVPGTLYKVRLKHASLNSTYLDKMQVMIGTPGHEQPVEMTRTSVNGHGDKLNEKSTTIATKVTNGNNRHHADQWETYEGTYLIPDGQTTTRFTFKSIDAKQLDYGNVLDDIVFDKAYKLSYDKNASDATGKIPSNQRGKENTVEPAKAKTTGTVKTVVDTSDGLPTELVNGDFEYPEADVLSQNLRDKKRNWWGVSRKDKMVYESDNPTKWVSLPSTFDSDRFAWDSSEAGKTSGVQEGSSQCHTNEVELQRDSHTGNMYAELSPYQAQSSIRQYIRTTPGTLYKVRLKHASLSSEYLDKMQVLIGADGNEQPVRMTRVESQNGLDATGKSTASTTISTHASNKAEISWGSGLGYHSSRNHDGQWATYEGVYVATSDVTVFMFKNVDSPSYNTGNLLDDVVFTKAYKLTYDKNAQDASGQVPSDKTANTVKQAKAKTTGTVRAVADRTASGLTVHDLKNGEIAPVQYGDFKFSTVNGFSADQVTNVNGFTVKTNWNPTVENQAYGGRSLDTMYQPNKNGANLILHHVGQWRDSSGTQRWLNAKITVNGQNLGSLVYYESQHKFLASYGKWDLHPSSRPYMDVTVDFLLDDGSTPQGLRGVTGFTDLDGGTSGYNEGVELVSGFDGAYVRSDAHLTRFGTNGWAGATDENENNADAHGMKHYVGATFTGSSFRVRWSVASGQARGSGFQPVDSTIAYRLTYNKNAQDATGSIPSDTAADTTRPAKSETDGKVSDLVQRTTTHEDGSVTVKTIDTSTDVVSGCQVYYPAGQRITLATMAKDDDCWDSSMLSRPGHTQLGWNQDRNATQAQAQVTMVEGGMTVYAVWVGNPVLTYDTNKPSTFGGQMPSTPASVSVPYNTAAADGSGWRSGDTTMLKPGGYKFLGWYTGPQDNTGLYDWTRPLTGSVTVYAHWQRLQANVVYNANGGTGSHPNTTGWQYSDVTIPGDTSKSFKRDKYVFKGWGTKPGKADVVYKDGSKVALQDKDITLYAQWQEVHENFVETGGIGLPIAIAGGVLLLMFGIGSTVMLTRRMNGHGMPDDE